jgi:hypothetical protein
VTISETIAEETVTNSISRDLGDLKITKYFDPLTSGFTGTFAISYDCENGTAHDGIVTLGAGESKTITGIPTGTTCWVSEGELPAAPDGWIFLGPIYNPEGGNIIISVGTNEVTVTNTIIPELTTDLSQLTSAKTKCSDFSAGKASDVERLFVSTSYNKKTGEYFIKKVAPSSFLYYIKASLPAEASVITITQNSSAFPYMQPSVTLFDQNCEPLFPLLANVVIESDDLITINVAAGESERTIYIAVKYTAKSLSGLVVDPQSLDVTYVFDAALDGTVFTSDDLDLIYAP